MHISIVIPPQGELSREAAALLRDYLRRVTRDEVPVYTASAVMPTEATVVVIGNAERNPLAGKVGFQQDWNGIRPDGYALRTLHRGKQSFIAAAGCEESGDKYAVYHLMRQVCVNGDHVEFEDYDVVRSPFIKTREVIMGNSSPWDPIYRAEMIPPEDRVCNYDDIFHSSNCQLNVADQTPEPGIATTSLRRVVERHCMENWAPERLTRYVTQMDAFGFNSLQMYDEWETYMTSGCLISRRQWREKVLTMLSRNRALGNRATLQTWGGKYSVLNGVRVVSDWDDPLCDDPVIFPGKENFASPCWNDPEDRSLIDAHLHYLSGYAPQVDHVISHYADPGGCNRNGCTLGTTMHLMNHQLEVFRGVNPRIKATFNTWPLTSNVNGYRIGDVLHRSSWNNTFSWWHFTQVVHLLHPEIMIANRNYNPQVAALCNQWGRGYGLWDWYSSDQEITASLHVEAERLGRIFGNLPSEAAADLDYYSLPNNCHGLSAATIYIAGQLLWTPGRDTFDILREFCDCVFGPNCAEAFYLGYEAIARIRNRDVGGDPAFDDTYLGAGTPDPAWDAERSSAALAALRRVSPDPEWVSKIPMATDARTMYEDLIDHLTLVYQYACFRDALRPLLLQESILPEQWKALPKVERLRVSGGMPEFRHVAHILSNAGVYDVEEAFALRS